MASLQPRFIWSAVKIIGRVGDVLAGQDLDMHVPIDITHQIPAMSMIVS